MVKIFDIFIAALWSSIPLVALDFKLKFTLHPLTCGVFSYGHLTSW